MTITEIDATYLGNQFSEMTFWQRLKFLFTGKTPKRTNSITPPPVMPADINPDFVTKPGDPGIVTDRSYTTFAGCDIKLFEVRDIESDATREEILETKKTDKCKAIGEVQGISFNVDLSSHQTDGSLLCILFNESIITRFKKYKSYPTHLILEACDEYGNRSNCIIPNIKFEDLSWGISVDDLVSEEHLVFRADEVMYWEKS